MTSIIRNTATNVISRTLRATRITTTVTPFRSAIKQSISQHSFVQQSRAFASFTSSRVCNVDDDAELRTLLKANSSGLVVVDWTASWCSPCRVIAPYYEELSAMPENQSITFIKADIDELPDASREAGVEAVPTFHFIKDNKMVAQLQGANMNKLKDLLEQHR